MPGVHIWVSGIKACTQKEIDGSSQRFVSILAYYNFLHVFGGLFVKSALPSSFMCSRLAFVNITLKTAHQRCPLAVVMLRFLCISIFAAGYAQSVQVDGSGTTSHGCMPTGQSARRGNGAVFRYKMFQRKSWTSLGSHCCISSAKIKAFNLLLLNFEYFSRGISCQESFQVLLEVDGDDGGWVDLLSVAQPPRMENDRSANQAILSVFCRYPFWTFMTVERISRNNMPTCVQIQQSWSNLGPSVWLWELVTRPLALFVRCRVMRGTLWAMSWKLEMILTDKLSELSNTYITACLTTWLLDCLI